MRTCLSHALICTNTHRDALDEESAFTIPLVFAVVGASDFQHHPNPMAHNVIRKLQVAGSGGAGWCFQAICRFISKKVRVKKLASLLVDCGGLICSMIACTGQFLA